MRCCPICESRQNIEIPYKFNDLILQTLLKYNIQDTFHWYLCKKCGNGYQFPKQDDRVLRDFWNSKEQGADTLDNEYRQKSSQRLFDYFNKHVNGKHSVLDIGCGHGYLLNEFKKVGFNVFGIDIDEKTKKSHQKLGIDSIIGQVEYIDLEKKYDVAFSTNSIYFIQNPVQFLNKIKSYLNKDGYLCISLSDLLASTNKSMPSYGLVFYPNYDSIDYILALAGYEVISKEKKLSNILIVCKVNDAVPLPKVNVYKIYFLIKTKFIQYYTIGITINLLHKLFSNTFISKIIKKIIKY